MNTQSAANAVVDVRNLAVAERHDAIFDAYRPLEVGNALEIVDDRDPKPLYYKFQLEAPGDFSWSCIDSGPDAWRVSVRKLGRLHAMDECCGTRGHCA